MHLRHKLSSACAQERGRVAAPHLVAGDRPASAGSSQRNFAITADRRQALLCTVAPFVCGHLLFAAASPAAGSSSKSSSQKASESTFLEQHGPYDFEVLQPEAVQIQMPAGSLATVRLCITLPKPSFSQQNQTESLPSALTTANLDPPGPKPAFSEAGAHRERRGGSDAAVQLPLAIFAPGFLVKPEAYQSYVSSLASWGFASVCYEQLGESALEGVDDRQAAMLLSEVITAAHKTIEQLRFAYVHIVFWCALGFLIAGRCVTVWQRSGWS